MKEVTKASDKIASKFDGMDLFREKEGNIPLRRIEVVVSASYFKEDIAEGFAHMIKVRDSLKAEQVKLTADELTSLFHYMLTMRVRQVNRQDVPWKDLKEIILPDYCQYILSLVGIYIDDDHRLEIVPVMDQESNLTYDEALKISRKLRELVDDFDVVNDCMPRKKSGAQGLMSCLVIDAFIRSYRRDNNNMQVAVAGLLNLKIKEETDILAKYEKVYNDINSIHAKYQLSDRLY